MPRSARRRGRHHRPALNTRRQKATLAQILSMARGENRMQRQEILAAQGFLRDWYGVEHTPRIRPRGKVLIALLGTTPAGADFDRVFLQAFSRHHYQASRRSLDCLVGHELSHDALERYCNGIVHAQVSQIDEMRELLCREFGFCDFFPFEPLHMERGIADDPHQ